MNNQNKRLIERVERNAPKYLDDKKLAKRVVKAMKRVDRGIFLRSTREKHRAYEDTTLPIRYGQTCSEPSMIAHMANKLELFPGQTVLEVGTGSGYSAAIHFLLISPGGILVTVEKIPELVEVAKYNLVGWYNRLGKEEQGNSKKHEARVSSVKKGYILDLSINDVLSQITIFQDNAYKGYPKYAPYDRIIMTAGITSDFDDSPLVNQLKDPGILLYPSRVGPLYYVQKRGSVSRKHLRGGAFVELTKD